MTLKLIELIILTIINVFAFFLVIVVLANSFKDRLYRWFVIMTVFLIGWVNCAYIGFSASHVGQSTLFYRLNWAFVSMFFFTAYIFYVENFLKIKKNWFKLGLLSVSSIFVILSLFTDTIIKDIVQKDWGNEIVFGIMNSFFNIFAVLITGLFIYYFTSKYITLPKKERQEVIYFLVGTFLFIAFNLTFNIFAPLFLNTAKYQTFGDFSAVVFLTFTAFAILKQKFLGVKIALTAFLVSIIGMFLIIDLILLSDNLTVQIVKGIILIFFVAVSIILVRSVLAEIRQREEIAQVNKELKQTNKALDKSRQKYFDLATEQKNVIDIMGHEIRTPLTAIAQEVKYHQKYTLPIKDKLLEQAKKSKELTETLQYLFETIGTTFRSVTHAIGITNDMLETARLDKQRFELNYTKFNIVEAVKSNVDLMLKTIDADSEIKYNIKFHKPKFKKLIIEADMTRINQAVYALIDNAKKYRNPTKSEVQIDILLSKDVNNVVVEIRDNGIGIKSEDISKLGKKFLRLDPKTKGNLPRPGGTGLGLFVIKGIMEHHHGELQIESAGLGQGSIFRLKFPIQKLIN